MTTDLLTPVAPFVTFANTMDIEDKHSIYVMAGGSTPDEVYAYLADVIGAPAVQAALASVRASDAHHLALATNYEGHFLGYGYLYCVSPALYHLLLGRQVSGLTGELIERPPTAVYVPQPPRWDVPQPRENWADLTDSHCPLPELRPLPPVVQPSMDIILKPARISAAQHTPYLRVWSLPDHLTAEDLWNLASPFTTSVSVALCRERQEAVLSFPEDRYDANFAAYFLRKVVLDDTTLVFRPMHSHETHPMYKDAEHYP